MHYFGKWLQHAALQPVWITLKPCLKNTLEPRYNAVYGVHCKWPRYSWSALYRNVSNSRTIRPISMLLRCIAPQLSLMASVLVPHRHHYRHFLVLIVVLVEHWKWSRPPSFWTTLVHSRLRWSRRSPLQTRFVNQFSDWEIWGPKIYRVYRVARYTDARYTDARYSEAPLLAMLHICKVVGGCESRFFRLWKLVALLVCSCLK